MTNPLANWCACCDPGCPHHEGQSRCFHHGTIVVYRVDMEDETGTNMCNGCANDALESDVFTLGSDNAHE